ncbi:B-cell linker, isoform CRA_a [Rattus norvegicus]|uniref:B-cell linker, isoform CRA_a n=1 Tax=Rattus norvegicus TaxID=10116 RepID=A6JH69_RAT|nr:B-cell linker, isoform CRA_a [Rattus norvegicus]
MGLTHKKSLFLLSATEGLVTDKTLYSHQCFLPPRNLSFKSLYPCQGSQKGEAQLQTDRYLASHLILLLQTRRLNCTVSPGTLAPATASLLKRPCTDPTRMDHFLFGKAPATILSSRTH